MKEIREYIRAELRKIDASYAEHETEMKFESLPATKINNLYRLAFGEFKTKASNSNHYEDEGPVEIKLYRKIEKSNPGAYDRNVDLAKRVRAALAHPKNYAATLISNVASEGFGVAPYVDNQDIYEIKINLTFTVSNSL